MTEVRRDKTFTWLKREHKLIYGPDENVPAPSPHLPDRVLTLIRMRNADEELLKAAQAQLHRNFPNYQDHSNPSRPKLIVGTKGGLPVVGSFQKVGNSTKWALILSCGTNAKGHQPKRLVMKDSWKEPIQWYADLINPQTWINADTDTTHAQAGLPNQSSWVSAYERWLVRVWAQIFPDVLMPQPNGSSKANLEDDESSMGPPATPGSSKRTRKSATTPSSSSKKRSRRKTERAISDGAGGYDEQHSEQSLEQIDKALDEKYDLTSAEAYYDAYNKRTKQLNLDHWRVLENIRHGFVASVNQEIEGLGPPDDIIKSAHEMAEREGKDVDKTIIFITWVNQTSGRSSGGTETIFFPSLDEILADEARDEAAKHKGMSKGAQLMMERYERSLK